MAGATAGQRGRIRTHTCSIYCAALPKVFVYVCAETKKFGAKRHEAGDSPVTPRSPQAQAAPGAPAPAPAPEPSTRNAILSKIAQADFTGGPGSQHGRDIRSKFMNVSKKVRSPLPHRPLCMPFICTSSPHTLLLLGRWQLGSPGSVHGEIR